MVGLSWAPASSVSIIGSENHPPSYSTSFWVHSAHYKVLSDEKGVDSALFYWSQWRCCLRVDVLKGVSRSQCSDNEKGRRLHLIQHTIQSSLIQQWHLPITNCIRFKQYSATPLALYTVSRGKEHGGDSQPHVVELGETAFNCLLHSPMKSFDQYRIFTQEIPQRGSKASEIIDRYFKGFWQNTKFGFLQWHHIQAN